MLQPWQFDLRWTAFSHKEDNKQKKWNGRLLLQDSVVLFHSQLALANAQHRANVAHLKPLVTNLVGVLKELVTSIWDYVKTHNTNNDVRQQYFKAFVL